MKKQIVYRKAENLALLIVRTFETVSTVDYCKEDELMKTLILTDQEFNKLYEVFEPTYIALTE